MVEIEKDIKKQIEDLELLKKEVGKSSDSQIEDLRKLRDEWSKALDINDGIEKYEGSLETLVGVESESYKKRLEKAEKFATDYEAAMARVKSASIGFPDTNTDSSSSSSSSNGGSSSSNSYTPNSTALNDDYKFDYVELKGLNDSMTYIDYLVNKVEWETASAERKKELNALNQAYRDATGKTSDTITTDQAKKELEKYGVDIPKFSEGGVADFTGIGKFHGSTSKPELVLNNTDTKKLYDYIHNTDDLCSNDSDTKNIKPLSSRYIPITPENINSFGFNEDIVKLFSLDFGKSNINPFANSLPISSLLKPFTQMTDEFIKVQNSVVNNINNTKQEVPSVNVRIDNINLPNVKEPDGFAKAVTNTLSNEIIQKIFKK